MTTSCHYATLGVLPQAETSTIRGAYEQALVALREAASGDDHLSAARRDELHAAWSVLGDPQRRAAYDTERATTSAVVITPSTTQNASADPIVSPLRFAGDGTGYFRIWIVNLALTVLTVGIYSAWAKVRREQFFHRALRLEHAGFDYHGTPLAILKGRLVAVGAFVLLTVAQHASDLLYWSVFLALFALSPWLLVKALRFRARNTSYRGLRFVFDGSIGDAAKVMIGFGLLAVFTLGIFAPLFLHRLKRYTLGNLRYGGTRFTPQFTEAPFFMGFFAFAGVYFVVGIGAAILIPALSAMLGASGLVLALPLIGLGFIVGVGLARAYFVVKIGNTVWNHTGLGAIRFHSRMSTGAYARIILTNTALLILTLGCYWPWALVRTARYRAEHTDCLHCGELSEFVASAGAEADALGDEMAEAMDFDVGI